jgi:glutathione S-transferase
MEGEREREGEIEGDGDGVGEGERGKEATLLEDLKSKLADLDRAIGDGPLLLGEEMSEQDCRLAPFLFHINSA